MTTLLQSKNVKSACEAFLRQKVQLALQNQDELDKALENFKKEYINYVNSKHIFPWIAFTGKSKLLDRLERMTAHGVFLYVLEEEPISFFRSLRNHIHDISKKIILLTEEIKQAKVLSAKASTYSEINISDEDLGLIVDFLDI